MSGNFYSRLRCKECGTLNINGEGVVIDGKLYCDEQCFADHVVKQKDDKNK